MKIKETIQALIASFVADRKQYEDEKAAIEAKKMNYTPVYLNQLRAELDSAFEQKMSNADASLNAIFQNAIDKISAKRNYRPEFKESVATALSYISAMGDNINDDMAYDLVKPLLGDYQTMARLYLVLESKLDTGEKTEEDTTLFALAGYTNAVNMLKEMQTKFMGSFTNANSPAAIEIHGASANMTAINQNLALDSFYVYIMRDVDNYEVFIDKVEEIYSVNAGYVA